MESIKELESILKGDQKEYSVITPSGKLIKMTRGLYYVKIIVDDDGDEVTMEKVPVRMLNRNPGMRDVFAENFDHLVQSDR